MRTTRLTQDSEQRYQAMDRDFRSRKKMGTANSVEELVEQLHEGSVSSTIQKTLPKKSKTVSKS